MTSAWESAGSEKPMDSPDERSEERARVRAHWYSVATAARLLGISETALRKRIGDGALTAVRGGRGWRVLLPGEPTTKDLSAPGQSVDANAERAGQTEPEHLIRTSESLVALVRDLQRQNLALAGHIGYLQSQVSGMKQQLEMVEHPQTAARASSAETVTQEEHDAALREVEELRRSIRLNREEVTARRPKKRRWWNRM